MVEMVMVINPGTEMVLVGERYLLPGERRQVTKTIYEKAKERYPSLALVDELLKKEEPESEAPPEEKKISERRGRKQVGHG
jgi:hypothetical protein